MGDALPPRAAARDLALLGAAFLLPPLAFRLGLPAAIHPRGLASDLAAALVGMTLAAACGHRRTPRALGALLWALVHGLYYEHVRVLDAVPALVNLRYLADSTFVSGSLLHPARPVVLWTVAAVAAVLAAWPAAPRPPWRWATGALAVLVLVLVLWPGDPAAARWRQTGPAVAVVEELASLGRPAPEAAPAANDTVAAGLDALWSADLDGEPIVERQPAGTNVLLVLFEGVSGAHLASAAAAHGRTAAFGGLPHLDRAAQSGLLYTSFVAQQRQTDRGEYAVLCGDHPKLGSAVSKMSELADGGERPCLPRLLADAGYRTVYLQAAPLAFMRKDNFLPKIGFERVLGNESFATAHARNQWGVDDATLLEKAAELVAELEDGGEPWLLTLLTVGTHHPYLVPDDLPASAGDKPVERALAYLDEAAGAFVDRLDALGARRDTLVVFTSDESLGLPHGSGSLDRTLAESWGLLVVLTPDGTRRQVDELFQQSDLALSILDVLGLADDAPVLGRSVFRSYPEPRPSIFANVYKRQIGAHFGDGETVLCREDGTGCAAWASASPWSPERRVVTPTDERLALLRQAARRSRETTATASPAGRHLLIAGREVEVYAALPRQIVFAGQSFSFAADTRLDVFLDVELRGRGRVRLDHDLLAPDAFHHEAKIPVLEAGDRMVLRYTCRSPWPLYAVQVRMWAKKLEGEDLELVFRRAEVRFQPLAPGWELADGWRFREHRAFVERGGERITFLGGWRDLTEDGR